VLARRLETERVVLALKMIPQRRVEALLEPQEGR